MAEPLRQELPAWAPYSGVGLLAGVLVQVLVSPATKTRRGFRILAWGVGVAGWFLSALVSCAQTLE